MTLEASFVVPMVIGVFAFLIYSSFYLYGRCVISQDAYILAFRTSIARSDIWEGDPVSYCLGKADEKAGKKYFGSRKPEFTASKEGDSIKVFARSSAKHRVLRSFFDISDDKWEYEGAGRAKRMEYSKHIRRMTRLRDIGEELIDYRGEE